MKSILVSGATGLLGFYIVRELMTHEDIQVYGLCGRPGDVERVASSNPKLRYLSIDHFFSEEICDIDTVINCAFSRTGDSEQLADSLSFTESLIRRLETIKAKSVINISTQGVYKRLPVGELATEESPIAPIDLYSMAKLATEEMFRLSSIQHITNIRLASLNMPQRFLSTFVQKVIREEVFAVTEPNSYASLMDVTDAAKGLVQLAMISPDRREKLYNLGTGEQYSVLDCAKRIHHYGHSLGYHADFIILDNGKSVCAGMSNRKFVTEIGWSPNHTIEDLIKQAFQDSLQNV